jgi:hypothetical protein
MTTRTITFSRKLLKIADEHCKANSMALSELIHKALYDKLIVDATQREYMRVHSNNADGRQLSDSTKYKIPT